MVLYRIVPGPGSWMCGPRGEDSNHQNIFKSLYISNVLIYQINTELIVAMAEAHNHNYDKLLWFFTMIQILMCIHFYVAFYDPDLGLAGSVQSYGTL